MFQIYSYQIHPALYSHNNIFDYKNTLNSVQLKDEEMFSIMIFKNLYPSDFADLEFERGIIKDIVIQYCIQFT